MSTLGVGEYICAARAVAPLVAHLNSVAYDWAVWNKKPALTETEARRRLCDVPSSPCSLLNDPLASIRGRHATALGSSAPLAAAIIRLMQAGWTISRDDAASTKVLLVDRLDRIPTSLRPSLVLLLPDMPAGGALASAFANASLPSFDDAFLLPPEEAPTPPPPPPPVGRRRRMRSAGGACHVRGVGRVRCRTFGGALLLRRAERCALPPLYDLETRRHEVASAAEALAARDAMRRGVSFSEWFACNTLEPLKHIGRQLFVASRRARRSVWRSCVLPHIDFAHGSPCQWFMGNHTNHENFVWATLASPDVLLGRMSLHHDAVGRGGGPLPPLYLFDTAAGEGNYTQHLPDAMGRLPALQLVERYGWHGLLLEPAPPTFRWLQHNFRAAPPGAATLRQVGVTAEATPQQVTMHVLAARVPELEGTAPADEPTVAGGSSRGLPAARGSECSLGRRRAARWRRGCRTTSGR